MPQTHLIDTLEKTNSNLNIDYSGVPGFIL